VKVWLDGKIVEGAEARIPVTDHGFLYGDGVFEGIRVLAGRVYRLDDHMARLDTSARGVGMDLAAVGGRGALREIVLETLRAFDRDDAYVRLIVSRGEGALGVDPTTCPMPRVVCIVAALRLYPEELLARGLDLVTSRWRRPSPDVLDPGVKSLNYLNNAMAKLDAHRQGADEALLLNAAGLVAEASVANVFVVNGSRLRTPPPSDGALAGLTRAGVLAIAAEEGLATEERSLRRVDLLGADEVFLTGSGAGIVPVRSLDGESVGPGRPGPVTARIRAAFPDYARRNGTPFRVSGALS
jgi:branched-chain amino acid aminotransferase